MANLYSRKGLFTIRNSLLRTNTFGQTSIYEGVLSRPPLQDNTQEWLTYKGLTVYRIRYQLILSRDVDNQRILKFDRTRDTLSHTQPKVVFLPPIWMGKKHNWHNLTKKDNLRCYLSFVIIYTQKNSNINSFFLEILMIADSYDLIGWDAQLATPDQKWYSQMLPSLAVLLDTKITI